MTNRDQLELGLDRAQAFTLHSVRQPRLSRAQWWFQQMRQVVDQAFDWHAAPPAPPEQTWLTLPRQTQRA